MILPYGPILFHDITYMAIIIMKTLFLQTMKNASCKKLIIDRSKAKKVGTLKDTSFIVWEFHISCGRRFHW